MITVVLALSGALAYGVSDFLGGLASRRIRPLVATAWAALFGIVPLLIGLLILGGRFTADAVLWGVVAGLAGSIGVLFLYTALAIGPMSVLSPVTSVVAVVIPIAVALLFAGSRLSWIGTAAIVTAVIAVALVSTAKDPSGARLTTRGLIAAGIAGCGFGGLVLAYSATSPDDGLAPLVVARVVQSVVMWAGVAVVSRRRGQGGAGRVPWLLLAICGTVDAAANVLIQAALHTGAAATTLPVVSVLNALYPIGTVILAAVVLRERLSRLQVTGLALALASSAVLASL